ncbi:MAG TPA: glycosyltransferase [Planctomycetota bacterium]|nr:glycosyltransferase [Planctomycetota bacterium]
MTNRTRLAVQKVSVVVATYNRADYLRLCLACLRDQDYAGPWEIVVSDDGSTDHTAAVIAEARARRPDIPIAHRWHEHQSYRRAFTVNEGVRQSTGDLLVFLDSDCLPARDLVRTYVTRAVPRAYYLGGVWKLTRDFMERALASAAQAEPGPLLAEAAESHSQKPNARKRVRTRYWQSRLHALFGLGKPRIWGGNFALSREVFEAVNGLDENFVGYGQEDSDFRDRLVMSGCRPVCLHLKAVAYHLWHPLDMQARHEADGGRGNRVYYNRANVETVCRNGLRKL